MAVSRISSGEGDGNFGKNIKNLKKNRVGKNLSVMELLVTNLFKIVDFL